MTTVLPCAHKWITISDAAARLGIPERELASIYRASAPDSMCDMWTGETRVRLADIELIKAADRKVK